MRVSEQVVGRRQPGPHYARCLRSRQIALLADPA